MPPLSTKRVMVTGGAGFLGSAVTKRLGALGCRGIIVPRSREYDLRERADARRVLDETRPDVVIHIAAKVGEDLASAEEILVTGDVDKQLPARIKRVYARTVELGGKSFELHRVKY